MEVQIGFGEKHFLNREHTFSQFRNKTQEIRDNQYLKKPKRTSTCVKVFTLQAEDEAFETTDSEQGDDSLSESRFYFTPVNPATPPTGDVSHEAVPLDLADEKGHDQKSQSPLKAPPPRSDASRPSAAHSSRTRDPDVLRVHMKTSDVTLGLKPPSSRFSSSSAGE